MPWGKVAMILCDYFEEMLFCKDSITEPFARVQSLPATGNLTSDYYLCGERESEVLSLLDEIEYSGADSVRVKLTM